MVSRSLISATHGGTFAGLSSAGPTNTITYWGDVHYANGLSLRMGTSRKHTWPKDYCGGSWTIVTGAAQWPG